MAYNGLTKLGAEYLSKCLANNKPVIFKKIKVGNGSIPEGKNGKETTALYSQKKEVNILSKEQVENSVKLTVLLNNLDLTAGFYVKEMGIFIEDDGIEKLYWYINKDNPSFLPDKNTPSKHRYNVYCEVSSSESVIVNFSGKDLFVDKEYVDNRTKIATHAELGRIKVGENLTISEDGTLDIQICTPQEMVALVEKYKA